MSTAERREQIMEALLSRREDRVENLAGEFGVSERTIRRDLEELTLRYPIETVRGMYGGVRVSGWYRQGRSSLSPEETGALRRASVCEGLSTEDRRLLGGILNRFARVA